jgi:hypothetical protein
VARKLATLVTIRTSEFPLELLLWMARRLRFFWSGNLSAIPLPFWIVLWTSILFNAAIAYAVWDFLAM